MELSIKAIKEMTDDACEMAFREIRWPKTNGEPICPRCDSGEVYLCNKHYPFMCKKCNYRFTATSGTIWSSRKQPIRTYLLAMVFFSNPENNALRFSKEFGVQYKTAWSLMQRFINRPARIERESKKRTKKVHYLNCSNCKIKFWDKAGSKTSDLKTGKVKNAYCSSDCRRRARSSRIENDRCKGCNATRKDLTPSYLRNSGTTGVTFNGGYCIPCWQLRRIYHKDQNLITIHQLTQQLKKEIQKCHQQ